MKPTVRYIDDILKREVSFILKFRDKNLTFEVSLDLKNVSGQESDIIQALTQVSLRNSTQILPIPLSEYISGTALFYGVIEIHCRYFSLTLWQGSARGPGIQSIVLNYRLSIFSWRSNSDHNR